MANRWCVLLLGALFLLPLSVTSDTLSNEAVSDRMLWFEDAENRYPDLEALQAEEALPWQPASDEGLSRGFNRNPHWFFIQLPETDQSHDRRHLQIPNSLLRHLEVYVVHNDELQQNYVMGKRFPFAKRPVAYRNFVAPFILNDDGPTKVYLRVQTNGSVQVAPILWTPDAFAEEVRSSSILSGLFYGMMLVMFFYHLFIYLVVREISYLYYIGYVAAFTMFIASLRGDAFQYLWPGAVHWNTLSLTVLIATLGVVSSLFIKSFLDLRKHWPLAHHTFTTLVWTSSSLLALSFVLPYEISVRINTIHGIGVMLAILAFSSGMWWKGHRHARYFVLAWVALLAGTTALALGKFGVLPWNLITENGAQIGAVMEILLLSFALGDRINRERAKRFRAQQETIRAAHQAKAAQDELLAAKETANQELEERVKERTQALEKAMTKLETVNKFLEQVSTTDQLTNLRNRRFFLERYHEEFKRAQRGQYPLSIVMMDIDHFKSLNDTYGHLAGDDCLKGVARVMSDIASRAGDTLARYGGEEFILLLNNTDGDGAYTVAERIRAGVENLPVWLGGEKVAVTLSLGIAEKVPQNPHNPEELIKQADDALYEAKEGGRNRICRYNDEQTS